MLFWLEHSDFAVSLSEKQEASDQKSISDKMRELWFKNVDIDNLMETESIVILYKERTYENIKLKCRCKRKNVY